jgi:hypothetical protein
MLLAPQMSSVHVEQSNQAQTRAIQTETVKHYQSSNNSFHFKHGLTAAAAAAWSLPAGAPLLCC